MLVYKGSINKIPVVTCFFEYSFFGGSMGSVVGEKFTSAVKICIEEKRPLICFSASGGARMQESAIALMQMTRSVLAVQELKKAKLPYVVIMTNPTAGGVTASFAGLGDVLIGEPKAIIAFAGRRVIQDTVKEELPEEFQTAEFVLDHGFLDFITHRKDLKKKINLYLDLVLNNPIRNY